jgi:hypothetical protein
MSGLFTPVGAEAQLKAIRARGVIPAKAGIQFSFEAAIPARN